MKPLHALILAGDDPAHPSHLVLSERVAQKALIEVGSKPMLDWAVDAARNCPRVQGIHVVGIETPGVRLDDDIVVLPGTASLADNLLAGLAYIQEQDDTDDPVLVMGCDAPLVTAEALTWFVDACTDRSLDLYMAIVRRQTLESIFPRNRRRFLRVREGQFCSSDLVLVRPAALLRNVDTLRRIVAERKDGFSLVQMLGAGWATRALLGMLHLRDVRDAVQEATDTRIKVIELPFASLAMDVDTVEDLAMVRNEMAQRRVSS